MTNRYFQHLEKGDMFAKRTRLLYIDDITEDDMVLFYFEDGTKCNKDFIGETREAEPIKNNRAMVELASASAMWRFEKKIVKPESSGFMVGQDGVRYEAPDPNVKFSGGPGAHETTVAQDAKSGVRIDIIPPTIPQNYEQPNDDEWLLSLHPELEIQAVEAIHNAANRKSSGVTNQEIDNSVVKRVNPIQNQVASQPTVMATPQQQQVHNSLANPISTSVTETIRSASVNIDVDTIVKTSEYNSVTLVIDGQKIEITPQEFKNRLMLSSEQFKKSVENAKHTIQAVSNEIINNEDELIKNMVEKCKRERCKITLGMSLELPPKEVYETIKSVYAEGMCEQFVKSVIARVEQDVLINSLSSGLSSFYEKKCAAKTASTENSAS